MGELDIQLKDANGNLLYPKSKTSVVQEKGQSETLVMSQKAVTDGIDEVNKQYYLYFDSFKWTNTMRWEGNGGRSFSSYSNSIASKSYLPRHKFVKDGVIKVRNDSDNQYRLIVNWFTEAALANNFRNAVTNEWFDLNPNSTLEIAIKDYPLFCFAFDNGGYSKDYQLDKIYLPETLSDKIARLTDKIENDVSAEDIRIRDNFGKYRGGSVNYNYWESTPNAGFRFFHFSDLHEDYSELEFIIALANKWKKEGMIDAILNTGDTTLTNATSDYTWFKNLLKTTDVDLLSSVGNHDSFGYTDNIATNYQKAYENIIAPTASNFNIVQPDGADETYLPCYYKDYGDVRVIVIYTTYFVDAQVEWFQSVLNSSLSANKQVIIMNHTMPSGGANGLLDNYQATAEEFYNSNPNSFTDIMNWAWGQDAPVGDKFLLPIKEFEDNGGTFICWLNGHCHQDVFCDLKDHNKYGYQPQINITSARQWYSPYVKMHNHPSSHQFNYVCVDTQRKHFTILRIGNQFGQDGRRRHCLVYDYGLHRIIDEF